MLRDSIPIIRNTQDYPCFTGFHRHPDSGAQTVMLQGVCQDVIQRPAHLKPIQKIIHWLLRDIHFQRKSCQINFVELIRQILPEKFAQIRLFRCEAEIRMLGFAVFVKAVNQLRQHVCLVSNGLQILGQLLLGNLTVTNGIGIAGNNGYRRF